MTDARRWPDLTRFGARLFVEVNPAYQTSRLFIEVLDNDKFQESVLDAQNKVFDFNAVESFHQSMSDLGFKQYGMPSDNNFGFIRDQLAFKFAELQSIFPELEASDVCEMPISEIRHETEPHDPERIHELLTKHGTESQVFYRVESGKHYDGCAFDVLQFEAKKGENKIRFDRSVANRMAEGSVPANAITWACLTKEDAARYADGDMSRVTELKLPYAVPVSVDKDGGLLILKDARYAPEFVLQALERSMPRMQVRQLMEIVQDRLKRQEDISNFDSLVTVEHALYRMRRAFEEIHAISFPGRPYAPVGVHEHEFYLNPELRHLEFAQVLIPMWLAGLDRHMELKLAEAEAQAEEQREAAATEQAEQEREENGRVKHEDVGEKIGGARKDFAKHALTFADLEVMTEREKDTYVIKSNIWPALDYRQMREDGVEPNAAFYLKKLKDSIPTKPRLIWNEDRTKKISDNKGFIDAVTRIRNAVANVKTLPELQAALRLMRSDLGFSDNQVRSVHTEDPEEREIQTAFLGNIDQVACYRIHPTYNWQSYCYEANKKTDSNTSWANLIKERKAKAEADEENEESGPQMPDRPHLDHLERTGTDYRQGQDVTGEDLMETFGFRAVEYGNWLPQDERQKVLNFAYDAFADLADTLRIPHKAISLDGTLAIAFGSRGRGGKNAAVAHYEPARQVINLTRIKGAGSLAHEWGHALDDYFASAVPNVTASFLSEDLTRIKKDNFEVSKLHADSELAVAMAGVMRAIGTREKTLDERIAGVKKDIERVEQYTRNWIRQYAYYKGWMAESKRDAFQQEAYGMYAVLRTEKGSGDIAQKIADLFKKQTGRKLPASELRGVLGNISYLQSKYRVLEALETEKEVPGSRPNLPVEVRPSAYRMNAKQLDVRRSKPYWATPCELFARAFESYVFDRISDNENASEYLVHGVEGGRYSDEKTFTGNPYPSGDERLAINEKMDRLAEVLAVRFAPTTKSELAA